MVQINTKMKFSIITINKNNAKGLLTTIQSIRSQTCVDYEFIVIDGASTDSSLQIIELNSQFINYFISEPDSGVYNAMNKGILKSKGQYIIFMNSGDCFYSSNVLNEVQRLSNGSDIIFGSTIVQCHGYHYKINNPTNITFNYFFRGGVFHQSSFIKRDLFHDIGLYREDFSVLSDWAFFIIALAKHNNSFQSISNVISIYDGNGISTQSSYLQKIKNEREIVLKEEFPFYYKDYINYQRLRKLFCLDIFDNFRKRLNIYSSRILKSYNEH